MKPCMIIWPAMVPTVEADIPETMRESRNTPAAPMYAAPLTPVVAPHLASQGAPGSGHCCRWTILTLGDGKALPLTWGLINLSEAIPSSILMQMLNPLTDWNAYLRFRQRTGGGTGGAVPKLAMIAGKVRARRVQGCTAHDPGLTPVPPRLLARCSSCRWRSYGCSSHVPALPPLPWPHTPPPTQVARKVLILQVEELGRILREEREEREERGRLQRAERAERGRRRQVRLEAIRAAGGRAPVMEGGQEPETELSVMGTEESIGEPGKEAEEEEEEEEQMEGRQRDTVPSISRDDDEGGDSGRPEGATQSISATAPPSVLVQRRPPSISLRSHSALLSPLLMSSRSASLAASRSPRR